VLQADKLSGEWKLVYTSGSELSALLALSRLPFVTVGDITQTIDGAAGTVVNKVQHGEPRTAPGHVHLETFCSLQQIGTQS
jgi:PAP_fibrillin